MSIERSGFAFVTANGSGIGLGHLRRCLTLATELSAHGLVSFLVAGDEEGARMVRSAGFAAESVTRSTVGERLQSLEARFAVVDDYAIGDAELERLGRIVRLAAIDDLADRDLMCAAVLNPGAAADRLPYRKQQGRLMLLGSSYALLSRAYRNLPPRPPADTVRRVLVTLGGADPHNDMPLAITAVQTALPTAHVDVVVGPFFSDGIDAADARVHVHEGVNNLEPLMRKADLAVTAGGQTAYELAASGVPAVGLCIADNQRPNVDALARHGVLVEGQRGNAEALAATISRLAHDAAARDAATRAGRTLVDGQGAVRAAAALAALANEREVNRD